MNDAKLPGSTGELRRKSVIEDEFDKIRPTELGRVVRLQPRKYSTLLDSPSSDHRSRISASATIPTEQQIPTKRFSVSVVSDISTQATGKPIDYVGKGFCCTPRGHRKFAWVLCLAQAISMLLWLTSIFLVKYYWPAAHLTGRFLPGYLTQPSGRTRIIIFASLGSEPILSFLLLAACLLLARISIQWIRTFYVVNTWLSVALIITGIHILVFAANVSNSATVNEVLLDELKRYDDNATLRAILRLADTKVDLSAKQDWDQIQNFFKCCGITSRQDWFAVRNFFEMDGIESDELNWKVPGSCCQALKPDDVRKCTRFPVENPGLLWHPPKGCSAEFQELLSSFGALAGIQVFGNWLLQGLSIWVMRSYYAALRCGDGTSYKRNVSTFFLELFCVCFVRKRKPKARRSEWLIPVNEVMERSK